jgi:hypothetical protein
VNPGGEPERDDFGLPPVDIEIPDDARELDRDVQAYHREQRALRRRMRGGRLRGPLTRDGAVMPLLAGCLVFALIAAVLLTVFTATSGDIAGPKFAAPRRTPPSTTAAPSAQPGTPSAASASGAASAGAASTPLRAAEPLPGATIEVGPRNVSLRGLTSSVLALVPQSCACSAALGQLIMQAAQAGVPLYLVGTDAAVAGLDKIAAASTGPHRPAVADDHHNVLRTAYQASGLAALLVASDGSVRLAAPLPPGLQLTSEFRNLEPDASPGA